MPARTWLQWLPVGLRASGYVGPFDPPSPPFVRGGVTIAPPLTKGGLGGVPRPTLEPTTSRWAALFFLGAAFSIPVTIAPTQSAGADEKKVVWNFEADEPGKTPMGFSAEVGIWEVATDGGNHVLYQKARSADAVFNVALIKGTHYKDLSLSVRLRAIAGVDDRGGGVAWRAKDAKNYYIARYNPLEDNFRVYKVEGGKRTMFKDAKIPGDEKWHTLRITMTGNRIVCYLDGQKHLEAEDSTFPDAGMIGLWSKADAQSYFDDVTVAE